MSNNQVIQRLQLIQADAHEFWVKLHNYHWNVKGIDFRQIHTLTEEFYDSVAVLFDDVAERILQLGKQPLITTKDFSEYARLEVETKDSFDSFYVLNHILQDYQFFLQEFRTLSKEADEADDKVTIALADEMIAKLEKDIWIIKSTIS